LVSDYKERVTTPSKKKTISQINTILRLSMWLCIGISGLLIMVCAVAYISNSAVFQIKHITIKGNVHVKADEVLTLLDIEQGNNILSWNMNKARMRLQNHPWIKDVSISRGFVPASVEVVIVEHKPKAALLLKDRPYLISEEGHVFITSPDSFNGLTISAKDYTQQDMKQGLDQVLNYAIDAATLLQSKGLQLSDIHIEPGGLMDFRLKNGITLTTFGQMTPVKIEMAIKTMAKMNPPEGTVMDLRCDDKVVLRNRGVHGSQG
jgi:cell division septal protein FtsQ